MKITANHVAIGVTLFISYTTGIYLYAQTTKAVETNTKFTEQQSLINSQVSSELRNTSENNARVTTALEHVQKQLEHLTTEVYKR